ncbi:MAG: EF-Tu/IF-2/RF-3 family GTPase [Thermoplasmatota archaeon]
MRAVTVGLLGNLDYAQHLGKKGTESDVALYSFREGDDYVSVIVPIRHPEKPQPLVFTVNAAEALLFVVTGVTKELGESILAADAAGKRRAFFILQNFVQKEQIAPLIKGTSLENAEFWDDKPAEVRQKLAGLAIAPREGAVMVPVDHHFDVKGVGPVVLGFVGRGVVKKHDELRAWPTKKVAQVRSIQVHDHDVEEAHTGEHVGLALKNVLSTDLDRGQVLAPDGSLHVFEAGRNVKLTVNVSRFFKQGIELGKVYYLGAGWQWIPVKVKAGMGVPGSRGVLEAEPMKSVVLALDEPGILVDMDAKGQRIVGPATMA